LTALVAVETLLLVVLTVLVAGLLRSHAEIMRRLGPSDDGSGVSAPPRSTQAAPDVAGATLTGDAVKLSLASGATLLAFLSSGCTSCAGFWEAFGSDAASDLPAGTRVVAVTKDGSRESPSRLLELAPEGLPVVLSSAAWKDYAVPGTPYFVYVVDGAIQGEGMASQWPQLASMLRDAVYDSQLAVRRYGGRGEERASAIDDTLAAAGIGPDHPSLYPAGRPDPDPLHARGRPEDAGP
jgi:hypothetical protein